MITNANIVGAARHKKHRSMRCPILGSTADNWDKNDYCLAGSANCSCDPVIPRFITVKLLRFYYMNTFMAMCRAGIFQAMNSMSNNARKESIWLVRNRCIQFLRGKYYALRTPKSSGQYKTPALPVSSFSYYDFLICVGPVKKNIWPL